MVRISIFLAGFTCLVLIIFGSLAWLTTSDAGSAWVINRVLGLSGADIRIGRVEGTLLGQLEVDDVVVVSSDGEIRVDRIWIRSSLSGLFPPALEISNLDVSGITLHNREKIEKNSDTGLTLPDWPELPTFLRALHVNIKSLAITGLVASESGRPKTLVEQLTGDLQFRDGILSADKINVSNQQLKIKGSFEAGLISPGFNTSLDLKVLQPELPIDSISLSSSLDSGVGDAILAGQLSLRVADRQDRTFNLAGDVAIEKERITGSNLVLTQDRRKGSVGGRVSVSLAEGRLHFDSQLDISNIDLEQETGQPLKLNGHLSMTGEPDSYSGKFDLKNQGGGVYNVSMGGRFKGTLENIEVNIKEGRFLEGRLGGILHAGWNEGWRISGNLSGESLDPEMLSPRLTGDLNLNVSGDMSGAGSGLEGNFHISLEPSILHRQNVRGEAQIEISESSYSIQNLRLEGEGLSLTAEGSLDDRLTLAIAVDNLSELLPEAEGAAVAEGWLRYDRYWSGEITAEAEELSYQDWSLEHLKTTVKAEADQSGALDVSADLGRLIRVPDGLIVFEDTRFELSGIREQHNMAVRIRNEIGTAQFTGQGHLENGTWSGIIDTLSLEAGPKGHWTLIDPFEIVVAPEDIRLSRLKLKDNADSLIQFSGNYSLMSGAVNADLLWSSLNLHYFSPWMKNLKVTGTSNGEVHISYSEEKSELKSSVTVAGALENDSFEMAIPQGEVDLQWNGREITGDMDFNLGDKGSFDGHLSGLWANIESPPERLQLDIQSYQMPFSVFQPWLPAQTSLDGSFSWNLVAQWREGERLSGRGELKSEDGQLNYQVFEEDLTAKIETASITWQLDKELVFKVETQVHDIGRLTGQGRLPLKEGLFPVLSPEAPWDISLSADLREKGLMEPFLAEFVQNTRGALLLDVHITGNLSAPLFKGTYHLTEGAAFVPRLGIRVQGIEAEGAFEADRVTITQAKAFSGDGNLSAQGDLALDSWQPASFDIDIEGQAFQLMNLPEVLVVASPDLNLSGSWQNPKVRGTVIFPHVMVRAPEDRGLAQNSPDLKIVGHEDTAERESGFRPEVDIKLIAGDRVLVDFSGIEARLGGSIELETNADRDFAATGKITVEKGRYSSYGVNLDITRGDLHFAGGPLDRPILDILALKTIGDVKAGVQVTGTADNPIVSLYSEPAMPDTDILSYMILGRPLDAEGGDQDLLMAAAGALLSQGESVVLQEKLKGTLGLDVLNFSAGGGDVNNATITTGKYLTPDLYVSFGYSLFQNTNEVTLRYHLTEDWEIESNIGEESGVDLFYRLQIE